MKQLLQLFQRGKAWKEYVQSGVTSHEARIAALEAEVRSLSQARIIDAERMGALEAELGRQLASRRLQANTFMPVITARLPEIAREGDVLLLAQRGSEVLLLPIAAADAAAKRLAGDAPWRVVEAIVDGTIQKVTLLTRAGLKIDSAPLPAFLELIREHALAALIWLEARQPQRKASEGEYFERLDTILAQPELIDFFAHGSVGLGQRAPMPFDRPDILPPRIVAEPKRRSVLLLHNNYYHFNCLAAGLKSRGWDALTVSLEAPDSPQRQFYHGEDLNLFDADPAFMAARVRTFLRDAPERFGALHFCGMGLGGFFSQNWENVEEPSALPWDLLELRRHNVIIGYMPSGCLDGGLQSSIHALTGGLCDRCVWQLRPDVCSDARSLAWNRKLARYCDWVGLEFDHVTPERVGAKSVYGPVVTTLDPSRWHPDIEPPDDMRLERQPGEVLVYHAVGNYEQRRKAGRDIKGTGAVMAAVERLQAEGLPVRLIFAHDVPSTQVRFLQVQADIVVDQLNYGRYGANAREAMMLGKPTICRLTPQQAPPLPPSRAATGAPMLDATESSVTDVLRNLVLDPSLRADLGRRARAYAVAWHGQDACAERYEKVIDRIRAGLPPETPELYPPSPDPAAGT